MNDIPDQHRQALRVDAKAHNALVPATDTHTLQGLLHELQVHQLELEMQNEELCRVQAALEASRDRYQQLYHFAPVGYITLTEGELITEANHTCAELLGVASKSMINRRFAHYIASEDSDRWHRFYRQATHRVEKQSIELALRRADGSSLYAQLDCLRMEADPVSALMRITLTDITERRQARQELSIAAAAFETQEGIIVTDANRVILRVNRAFSRITGYSAEEVCGLTPAILRSGRHNDDFYQQMWAAITHHGYWQGEVWDKARNGEIFPSWSTITAVRDTEGHITHYVGSFTDIGAQKQAEKVLSDARNHLQSQVESMQTAMDKLDREATEINATLGVLLKYRETDKSEAQNRLSSELEGCVMPFLKRLKETAVNQNQTGLIDAIETNLQHILKYYGRVENLPAAYKQLSPVEIQVASLVRQGLATKLIAKTLNISPGTVGIHRKHIRKKLALDGKNSNLHSYLLSLNE
jgi:PAS domain S-box-containing protein